MSPKSGERRSNRMAACPNPNCSRIFTVCGKHDRGRRFCSSECAAHARRSSVRVAGRCYQATTRGRQLHAARQARYRERLRRVTHQPHGGEQKPARKPESRREACARPGDRLLPGCSLCGASTPFLRNAVNESLRRRAEVTVPAGKWCSGPRGPTCPSPSNAPSPAADPLQASVKRRRSPSKSAAT